MVDHLVHKKQMAKMSSSRYQHFWGLPVENCFFVSQTTFNFACQIVQKECPDIQTREVTFMSRLRCKKIQIMKLLNANTPQKHIYQFTITRMLHHKPRFPQPPGNHTGGHLVGLRNWNLVNLTRQGQCGTHH